LVRRQPRTAIRFAQYGFVPNATRGELPTPANRGMSNKRFDVALPERNQYCSRSAVVFNASAIVDALAQEQDPISVVPYWLEQLCFCPTMQQCDALAVLS
jgi:hypothetical protein